MKNVLITAIGSFSADIAIKTCKEELGYRVIGCDIYPMEWIAQSLDVDVFYQAPYAVDEENYMDFITRLIKEEEINFILPSTDVEVDVLTKYRDLVKNAGATLCISGAKTIERCRNKMEFAEFVKVKFAVFRLEMHRYDDVGHNAVNVFFRLFCVNREISANGYHQNIHGRNALNQHRVAFFADIAHMTEFNSVHTVFDDQIVSAERTFLFIVEGILCKNMHAFDFVCACPVDYGRLT